MKLSIIAPPALCYYEGLTDYHLLPAHHLQSPNVGAELRTFYRRLKARGDYLILDNGVTERGYAMEILPLLQLAQSVGAQEVVLPDSFDDAVETFELVNQALDQAAHAVVLPPNVKFMAVVHGKTPEEWTWLYNEFANNPRIAVLGLPKVMSRNFINRTAFVLNYLQRERAGKEHHLLGVWDSPRELYDIGTKLPWIRGIDTSLPVMSGIYGERINDFVLGQYGFQKRQLEEDRATDPYPEVTLGNILCLMRHVGESGE